MIMLNNRPLYVGNVRPLIVVESPAPDPYNPLNLPPNTVRVRTMNGKVPQKNYGAKYETATLVPGTTDVYDVYKSGTDFSDLLKGSSYVIEVLGANTSNITNMYEMLNNCYRLTTVPLFDTSKVTMMGSMFNGCSQLTTVPLFDTSKVTNMSYAFYGCYNVQSGALALYQQASSQSNPPSNHSQTFTNCGRDTTTGAAELAQIGSGWK